MKFYGIRSMLGWRMRLIPSTDECWSDDPKELPGWHKDVAPEPIIWLTSNRAEAEREAELHRRDIDIGLDEGEETSVEVVEFVEGGKA